jgi:hypothetical protein
MKYMLMMNVPRDAYAEYTSMPKQDFERHIAYMRAFARKVNQAGELVLTEGLASPTEAKRVKAGRDGKPITDGIFPESKEYLAGWWIVDVDNSQRAYELAAEISAQPGIGGVPANIEVEVREIMSGPPA